jgi:hypothetical protein
MRSLKKTAGRALGEKQSAPPRALQQYKYSTGPTATEILSRHLKLVTARQIQLSASVLPENLQLCPVSLAQKGSAQYARKFAA